MTAQKNERKINSLLSQMNQQTGYNSYKEKAELQKQQEEELSRQARDLSMLERQDPLRIAPMVNENNREERVKEDERHRVRQRTMERVYVRQRLRERMHS